MACGIVVSWYGVKKFDVPIIKQTLKLLKIHAVKTAADSNGRRIAQVNVCYSITNHAIVNRLFNQDRLFAVWEGHAAQDIKRLLGT